ncbi:hypothetical protein HZS_1119, partial [Henneguya salminicola]
MNDVRKNLRVLKTCHAHISNKMEVGFSALAYYFALLLSLIFLIAAFCYIFSLIKFTERVHVSKKNDGINLEESNGYYSQLENYNQDIVEDLPNKVDVKKAEKVARRQAQKQVCTITNNKKAEKESIKEKEKQREEKIKIYQEKQSQKEQARLKE